MDALHRRDAGERRLRGRHRPRGAGRRRRRGADPPPSRARRPRARQGRAPAGVRRRSRAERRSFLDGVLGGMFTAPGDGDLDFAAVMRALADDRLRRLDRGRGRAGPRARRPARLQPARAEDTARGGRGGGPDRAPAARWSRVDDEPAGATDGARRGRPDHRHHPGQRRLALRRLRGAPAGARARRADVAFAGPRDLRGGARAARPTSTAGGAALRPASAAAPRCSTTPRPARSTCRPASPIALAAATDAEIAVCTAPGAGRRRAAADRSRRR